MKRDKMLLEMYKIAIDGYHNHFERYNHWMNMYAIFNGALFVGLHSIIDKSCNSEGFDLLPFLQLLIFALGCISSWFWFFSAKGFYRWNISWVKTVAHHENKFIQNCLGNESKEDVYVYKVFRKSGKEKCFETRPFSTQKITQWFTGCVALAWSVITILFLVKNNSELGCQTIFVVVFILVTVIIASCLWTCRESDLAESHLVV